MRTILLAGAAALVASGCATVTRGSNVAWVVETDPVGAEVTTTNGFSCTTPCSLRMPRRSEFGVTIERDGYETVTTQITNQVAGGGGAAMAGNVLVGGIIGAGVDAGTGAMLDLVPNPLIVTLVPVGAAAEVPAVVEPVMEMAPEAGEGEPAELDGGEDAEEGAPGA